MSRRLNRAMLLAMLVVLCAAPHARPVFANTYQVTNANDSGSGSLREAIVNANNNPGPDTITFNLGAASTWDIALSSSLPALSGGGTTIDGPLDGSGRPRVAISGTSIQAGQGIWITSSSNTVRGLRIYGFKGFGSGSGDYAAGVVLSTAGATNNIIENNFIGTDVNGTAVGTSVNNNQRGALLLIDGASQNTVRNNLISGNGQNALAEYAVLIGQFGSSTNISQNNVLTGNKIGVDITGNTALPNRGTGVYINSYALSNTIGPDNIISGNQLSSTDTNELGFGVRIYGVAGSGAISGNKIQGNRIGVGANGAPVPNGVGGIRLDYSQGTIIGGANPPTSSDPDRGNIITSNANRNILVDQSNPIGSQATSGAQIINNYIGLNSATSIGANTTRGIEVQGDVANLTISGNVISSNGTAGVLLSNAYTKKPNAITISNNVIGTNAAGTAKIGGSTQTIGIDVNSGISNVTITSNLITGNGSTGVRLQGVTTATISNNGIGTLNAGNTPIGNGTTGVSISGGSTGVTVGPGNTISKHTNSTAGDGVLIDGSNNNVVKGNTITANFYGVRVDNGASNNVIGYSGTLIGATGSADGNTVRDNTVGVLVSGATTQRNRISRTTTSNNAAAGTHFGISISSNGANAGIQKPTVSGVAFSGGTLNGSINTNGANCGGPGCTIEVFQTVTSEPDEGKFFLTSFLSTGGSFSVSVTSCMPFLTFTTTDQNGNTSQFSATTASIANCNASEPNGNPVPDLSNQTPPSRTLGSEVGAGVVNVSFTATLTNIGGSSGTFPLALTQLPVAGQTTLTNLSVNPTSATLAAGAAQTITFSATVPQNAVAGTYTLRLTATTQGASATDTVDVTVVVPLIPGVTLGAASPNSKSGGPNAQVCFVHTITNTGNGTDTFAITVNPPTNPSAWAFTVTPASPVTLAKGESRDITICVTVPSSASGGNQNLTVQARSNTSPNPTSATQTDTVQVITAAVPQSSPVTVNADPGTTATLNHTLANVGNQAASFTIQLTAPSGWTVITPPTSPTPSLAPNDTTNFSYQLGVPANALAGPYTVKLRITAQDSSAQFIDIEDTVNVNKIAKLLLTPATQASTEAPNQVVTYTYTLENQGNFADTIQLAVNSVTESARGWTAKVVQAPSVTLNPGESKPIELAVSIPPGQPTSVVNVTTFSATSSDVSVNVSASATTSIEPVPGILLTPVNPVQQGTPGEQVEFEFTLMNSGSVDQTYSTELVSTNPATSTVAFEPISNVTLLPGETKQVTITIDVPAGQALGTEINALIRATANPSGLKAETLARVVIGPPYDVIIAPDQSGSSEPGRVIEYTMSVTNTGRFEDTFALSTQSSLGWRTSVLPASVRLQPQKSVTVTVQLTLPGAADAGAVDNTFVTARSVGDPTVSDTATATTLVEQVAGVNVAPSRVIQVKRGETVRVVHTLVNTGNGSDSFEITTSQELNWQVSIAYVEPRLGIPRGSSQQLQITVIVPADLPPQTSNQVTLRATSREDGEVLAELADTFVSVERQVYLPIVSR